MKLSKKLENMFSASAFAEAGEFDTARKMAAEDTDDKQQKEPAAETSKIKHGEHGGMRPSSTSV